MAFAKINPVVACSAYEAEEVQANIRAAMKRNLPRLHHLPEFMRPKGDTPIALAGGGPSIWRHLSELHQFDTVMAIGSAHDYLVKHGITSRYCLLVDAHPTVVASYISKPRHETTYLAASQCAESVFNTLDGYPIVMWHCIMKESEDFFASVEPGWQGLGGGCTTGLRALGMAMCLGYKNIHLFGYDSCLGRDDEGHAYPVNSEEDEAAGLASDRIVEIKFGIEGPGQRKYRCYPYHLAQAQGFETFVTLHHKHFELTFHGSGLLSDVYDVLMANKDKMEEAAKKAA